MGESGEFCVGPVLPVFEQLYQRFTTETAKTKMLPLTLEIEKFVHEEAQALFLCSPHALYTVNKHVDFRPYATTFGLAETRVSEEHWSCREETDWR